MKIRLAQAHELGEINQIIEMAIMTWDLPERVKRLTLPGYKYDIHDLEQMSVVVAEQDNTLVGVAAWESIRLTDPAGEKAALLLHGIYVDPQQHRQGIGTALFQAAEADARQNQLPGIVVKAQKGSEPFYQSQDMHKLEVVDQRQDFENRYYKSLA